MRFAFSTLSADDIFISYSRRDGNTYAAGLADALTKRGFSCFFDKLGTDADRNLPPSLTRKIQGCAMLVVIGSAAANRSQFVAQEVEEFARARGTSRAVPIYFGGLGEGGGWQRSLVGIAPEIEDPAALESGDPSPAVVNRIEKSFNYTRSKDRLRRYTLGATVTLALLVLASLGAALVARNQLGEARRAHAVAASATRSADQATERARVETERAGKAEADARRAQGAAATAEVEAGRQQQLAALASERAKAERAKADREARNARAAGLVSIARRVAEADPLSASLLLMEADSPSEPEDGVETARELLTRYVPKVTLRGHHKSPDDVVGIYGAAFSPDGRRVVTAGADGTARVWTNDRSARSVILRGHERDVLSAVFSPDGERVVTASEDGSARVFRTDGSVPPVVLGGSGLRDARFSPDGRRVLNYGYDNTATIQNADGSGRRDLAHPDFVTSAVWSPDGTRVLTGSADGNGRIWNAAGGGPPVVLPGGGGAVIAGEFSPDGQLVAIGSLRGGGRVWRADGKKEPVLLGSPKAQVQIVAFSPDGGRVALMPFEGSLEIWEASGRGQPVRIAPPKGGGPAHTIRFSRDGKRVLIAWHDGLAELCNADGTGTPFVLRGHDGALSAAAFSPDESEIVTASYDGTARIWARPSHDDPVVLPGEPHREARFSPDGRRVVAVRTWFPKSDPAALVWNADGSGSALVLRGHSDQVAEARFSPDGAHVLTASFDETARIWPLSGATAPIILGNNGGPVRRADYSPDGTRVFTVIDQVKKGEYVYPADGTIRVWRADGRGEPVVLRGHRGAIGSVAWSPDGRRLVSAGEDGTVRVWPANGVGAPIVLRPHRYKATWARFDPAGRRIVSVSADGTAVLENADGSGRPRVWRAGRDLKFAEWSPDGRSVVILADHQPDVYLWNVGGDGGVRTLRGHKSFVNTARFSPDGKYLATSSMDGTARVWLPDGTGEPLVLDIGGDGDVFWAEWSPDQTRVLTAGSSIKSGANVARVWTVGWKELIAQLRARTGECLPVEQRLKYLGEGPADAAARFAGCERGFGRSPEPK